MILRVIDFETTGEAPPAEIIEIGWCDVDTDQQCVSESGSQLFGAIGDIPPEALAVHHIGSGMLSGLPPCATADLAALTGARIIGDDAPTAIVAHFSDFESLWLTPALLGRIPMICTYKAALRVWPDAPKHSNQVLRYWLGLDLDDRAMPPHRAAPDAFVTAHILLELLKHVGVEDLIAWTKEPRVMPRLTFGKHRGSAWRDVPSDYLDWLLRSEMDYDTKWNAQRELDRRRKSA